MAKRTLAPMLKTATSIGAISRSMCATSVSTSSSLRASDAKPCASPPSPWISATSGASLSALRRVTQATSPSRAKRRAIAPPVASPAPTTRIDLRARPSISFLQGSTQCRRRRDTCASGFGPVDAARRSMTARVFISYRTSDGADKATALARDLDAMFGQEQIFLDKDDLPAGSRWRDEVTRALNDAPILLVLVTPMYLGARDGAGNLCIAREDDPVR